MGRNPVYDHEVLLDAAAALHVSGGPRAVTMAAVARAAGAPSGSVYHRFPNRAALLAALWHETARDFEAAHRRVLGNEPTRESALRAAVWIVEWCRQQPHKAAVLQAGRQAFEPTTWSTEARAIDERAERRRSRSLKELTRTVAHESGIPADEVSFALLGLPLAVVGPHLRAGRAVPASAVELVRRLATRLMWSAATSTDSSEHRGRAASSTRRPASR